MKTIEEIITEAINDKQNINDDGSINWNDVDDDLWWHEDAVNYTEDELDEGIMEYTLHENK